MAGTAEAEPWSVAIFLQRLPALAVSCSSVSAYDPTMAGEGTHESRDVEVLHGALVELGFEVPVEEELQALTASAEGEAALFALVIVIGGLAAGWKSFCSELGKALAQDAHHALKSVFTRRRIVVRDDHLRAVIDEDTPPNAIASLADPPAAPSGELVWDAERHRWKDSLE
jgi:hypothetical protein